MSKKDDELKVSPDSGLMKTWASQGYSHVYDSFCDGELTYNVHPRHLKEINNLRAGDLVITSEGDTALVVEMVSKDMQGFIICKVMIEGREFLYSTLELAIVGVER